MERCSARPLVPPWLNGLSDFHEIRYKISLQKKKKNIEAIITFVKIDSVTLRLYLGELRWICARNFRMFWPFLVKFRCRRTPRNAAEDRGKKAILCLWEGLHFAHIVHTSRPIWTKFGTWDVHRNLFSVCTLRYVKICALQTILLLEVPMYYRPCFPHVKAIPFQAWTGPEGSRRLRFPDFKTIGTWRC